MASFTESSRGIFITSLLDVDDIRVLFESVVDGTRREQICERLSQSIFFKDGKLFNYNPILRVFTCLERAGLTSKEQLKFILTEFLDKSVIHLTRTMNDEEREAFEALRNEFEKEYEKLRGSKFVKNLEQYVLKLSKFDINFDADKYSIHFENGRFDLRSGTFTHLEFDGRTKEMYVASCLPYNFVNEAFENIAVIDEYLRKCFPEPDAFDYIKKLIGKSLTADVGDCEFLINWGRGGGGKSTLLNMLSACLGDGIYIYRASATLFNSEHEMKMALRNFSPAFRFILVEELDKQSVKAISAIKRVCDGSITFRDDRSGVQTTEVINAKLIATSNLRIQLDPTDSGILRRGVFYEYKYRFTPNESEVNPSTLTFLSDPFYLSRMIPDITERNCSIFLFFAKEAWSYLQNRAPLTRPSCIQSGLELPSWSTFVESCLVRHANGSGRISKNSMLEQSLLFFKSPIDEKVMLRELQDKHVSYNKNGEEKGCRGVFIGVSFVHDESNTTKIPTVTMQSISGGGSSGSGGGLLFVDDSTTTSIPPISMLSISGGDDDDSMSSMSV